MRIAKWYLLAVVLASISLSSSAWASGTPIKFDQAVTGSIGSASQSVTYTFSANAGDLVDFTLLGTEGSLSPFIKVYGPANVEIGSANTNANYCGSTDVELNTLLLSAAGTYTLIIGDCSETKTGSYQLFLQRTNNPVGASVLPFGATTAGAIDAAGVSNAYTFSGKAKDVLDFTLLATSGTISPKILLYNPDGTANTSANSNQNYCGAGDVELNTVTLPVSGAYTVLIADCSDTKQGAYEIYAQRTDAPHNPVTGILFGQVQAGAVTSAAQSNTWTFSANANDYINFTLVSASAKLSPKLRIYSESTGEEISSANSNQNYCGSTDVELNTLKIPATGTYSVLIGDCADTNTGAYSIYSQRTNSPGGVIAPIVFNKTQTGTIGSATQSNTWIFSAAASQVFNFTLVATSGKLSPKLELYNPDGSPNSSANSNQNYCGSTDVELNTVTLAKAGVYTLLISDCADVNTGSYVLYTQSTNVPARASSLDWGGDTQAGTISTTAQSNTWIFSVASSATILNLNIAGTTAKGTLSPKLRLYNPDGSPNSSANSNQNYCGSTTAEMSSVALTQPGIYTLLVGDCADKSVGNYNLAGQCIGCQVIPTITWPAPAAITYGTALGAAQLDAKAAVNGTALAGTLAYSPAAGTVLHPGPHMLSVTFTPTDTADYTTATHAVSLTVNQATPSCTWATPSAIAYGTALSAAQLDASCSVTGTYAYSPSLGTVLSAGTQTLSLTFTPTDVTDYTNVQTSVQLVVTPLPTKVKWTAPAAIVYGTALSATQLNATASVPGTFAYTPAAGTVLPAGLQKLSVAFTPADATDYSAGSATTTIQVNTAVLTVTANNLTRAYGAANPKLTDTVTGFANGDTLSVVSGAASLATTATVASPPGAYPITAAIGTLTASNYTFTFVNGTLTVTQAKPAITWAVPASIPYGTALSATQLDATAKVPGTFAYSPASGTVLQAGARKLSVTFTPADTTDYANATKSVQLTVTQVTPTITWATPAPISAGAALSATQLDATANVPGTFVYSPPAGTVLAAGTQQLSVTFTPTDAVDYTTAMDSVQLSVVNPVPAVTLSATTLAFGNQPINTVSAVKTVQLTNAGGATLKISSIALTGANLTSFFMNDNCGAKVAAGASCSISVFFFPTATGAAKASVTITDNAAGSPQSIALTGTGQ